MQTVNRVKDPRKQRKKLFNAPAHIRHKLMAAPLAPELMKSRGIKSFPVRKGDTVRVVRGDRKGFEGKISRIDLQNYRLYIEGLTREKVDGTTIFISLHPSKVVIKNLNLDDRWRKGAMERKQPQTAKKVEAQKEKSTSAEKAKTEKSVETKEIPKAEKKPEKSKTKPETPKKAPAKKPAAEKAKEGSAVQKKKKAAKKETSKAAPGEKTKAKGKPAKEGGA